MLIHGKNLYPEVEWERTFGRFELDALGFFALNDVQFHGTHGRCDGNGVGIERQPVEFVRGQAVFYPVDIAQIAQQVVHALLRTVYLSDCTFKCCHEI